MANIKKCDRCGKTYPWEYKSTHARVMVYDDKQQLHGTDLCPECDKAAAEWMKVDAVNKNSSGDDVIYLFGARSEADFFARLVRETAAAFGSVSMSFTNGLHDCIYSSVKISLANPKGGFERGWYNSSIKRMTVKRVMDGYEVTLPGLVEFY